MMRSKNSGRLKKEYALKNKIVVWGNRERHRDPLELSEKFRPT